MCDSTCLVVLAVAVLLLLVYYRRGDRCAVWGAVLAVAVAAYLHKRHKSSPVGTAGGYGLSIGGGSDCHDLYADDPLELERCLDREKFENIH